MTYYNHDAEKEILEEIKSQLNKERLESIQQKGYWLPPYELYDSVNHDKTIQNMKERYKNFIFIEPMPDFPSRIFNYKVIYNIEYKDENYPHKCPKCSGAAYIGLNSVDCKNGC